MGADQHQELPRIVGRAFDLPLPALTGMEIFEVGLGVDAVLFQRAGELFRRGFGVGRVGDEDVGTGRHGLSAYDSARPGHRLEAFVRYFG